MTHQVSQVGGNHYQAEYQHWDWAFETRIGWLEGNATKYLGRFRRKNNKQDLEKSLSYIKKLIGACVYPGGPSAGIRPGHSTYLLNKWLSSAGLQGSVEGDIIRRIDGWLVPDHLYAIATDIQGLIDEYTS